MYTGRKLPLLYSATQNVPPEGSQLPPKNVSTEGKRPEGLAEDARPMQATTTTGRDGKRGGKKRKGDEEESDETKKAEDPATSGEGAAKQDENEKRDVPPPGSGTEKGEDSN